MKDSLVFLVVSFLMFGYDDDGDSANNGGSAGNILSFVEVQTVATSMHTPRKRAQLLKPRFGACGG